MLHAHEDTLRTMYDAFAKGDVETVMGQLTDDIEYHISAGARCQVATRAKTKSWASSAS